jgi:TolB protein
MDIELRRAARAAVMVVAISVSAAVATQGARLGLFTDHADVGEVRHKGAARTGTADSVYEVSGSGANIWGSTDAFHFVWREARGDLDLTADVEFTAPGGDPHRKAGWMIRASLDAGAPYADAVVHGDGLIALQYRAAAGGATSEIRSPIRAPARLRLQRDGDVVSLSVARAGAEFQPVGALVLPLPETVYAGLAVSAHDADRVETARFSNVSLKAVPLASGQKRVVESTLETLDVATGERRVVHRAREHFEAPNWTRDGRFLVFNQQGRLYRIPIAGGSLERIDTGTAAQLNNDHGYSPDGQLLAISHSPQKQSLIYVLPAKGGEPRLVTKEGPSYWHGWSPDGRTLAYCAERGGEFDVYTCPVEGGVERRLTTASGLDDGPDYSPDGRYIYFNSERTGVMRIWRMAPDGNDQEQVTFDEEYADWFPHPSPDGRTLVFVSFDKSVKGHPPNQDVVLRAMPAAGGAARVVARLFGGQGTINVPSWSPDSARVAFVSYRLVAPAP